MHCKFGSRAGKQYVTKLSNQLTASNPNTSLKVNAYKIFTNSEAYASRAVSYAPTADLFVFAGHGLKYDMDSSFNNNA